MKRTLILLALSIILTGCVTQVNTTSQGNNPPPIASSQKPSLLPSILNWLRLVK